METSNWKKARAAIFSEISQGIRWQNNKNGAHLKIHFKNPQ